uniref:Uncharacterized protein n=1 Tax=Glossina pallidipes TaxID=7398 RepID=A0A1A9ZBR1_GLOPL
MNKICFQNCRCVGDVVVHFKLFNMRFFEFLAVEKFVQTNLMSIIMDFILMFNGIFPSYTQTPENFNDCRGCLHISMQSFRSKDLKTTKPTTVQPWNLKMGASRHQHLKRRKRLKENR